MYRLRNEQFYFESGNMPAMSFHIFSQRGMFGCFANEFTTTRTATRARKGYAQTAEDSQQNLLLDCQVGGKSSVRLP